MGNSLVITDGNVFDIVLSLEDLESWTMGTPKLKDPNWVSLEELIKATQS